MLKTVTAIALFLAFGALVPPASARSESTCGNALLVSDNGWRLERPLRCPE